MDLFGKTSITNGDKTNNSKRKSSNAFIKAISKRGDTRGNECNFYIVLTLPNIELIWCEENEGQDAYTHPIYEQIKNRTDWMTENKFFAIHSWRRSREDNSVVYNNARVGQGSYPRRYYLRIVDDNESTPETRNDILQKCAMVR